MYTGIYILNYNNINKYKTKHVVIVYTVIFLHDLNEPDLRLR